MLQNRSLLGRLLYVYPVTLKRLSSFLSVRGVSGMFGINQAVSARCRREAIMSAKNGFLLHLTKRIIAPIHRPCTRLHHGRLRLAFHVTQHLLVVKTLNTSLLLKSPSAGNATRVCVCALSLPSIWYAYRTRTRL